MATLAGPAKYQLVNMEVKFGKLTIPYQGLKVLTPAFEDYLPYMRREPKPLPAIKKGDKLPVKSVIVKEEQTQPPPYLSEVDLIKLMD
jgi:DNA topoisomerase-1